MNMLRWQRDKEHTECVHSELKYKREKAIMNWTKENNRYTLEDSKIFLEFSKSGSYLYAKAYFEGKLMFSFNNPIKNQKVLKDAIVSEIAPLVEDKSRDDITDDRELNNALWCKLNEIRNSIAKF